MSGGADLERVLDRYHNCLIGAATCMHRQDISNVVNPLV